MLADTAREIVARYFLGPGETVTGVDTRGQAALVSAGGGQWQITPVERLPGGAKSEGYALHEVRPYVAVSPPPRPDGVAVLPDGAMYRLGDDEECGAFWGRACAWMSPQELAALLARYAGRGLSLARHQTLIVTRADIAKVLAEEQIDTLAEYTDLRFRAGEGGGGRLEFCTYYLDQAPPDFAFRVGLNRWRAEWGADCGLRRAVRPIAEGLDSPAYS